MKTKYLIAVLIILSGAVLASGVLFFPNFFGNKPATAGQNPQWTQDAGTGITVPACSSASAGPTCVGTDAQATISWIYGGQHGGCGYAVATLSPGGFSSGNKGCNDSHTFTGLSYDTTYNYSIAWHIVGSNFICDVYDPETGICFSGHFEYYDFVGDSSEAAGSTKSPTTFTTPNCAQYTLSVSKIGSGSGTVSGPGISCGGDCSESYISGTVVTLSASPDTSSTFAGWSGGGCSGTGTCAVTMTQAISVTANFTLNTYTLSVSKTGAGSGTITSNPAGINCGPDCSETYNYGTPVTLTASSAAGSTFTGWSGEGCSGTGTCAVSMTQARNVTANFNLLLPGDFTLNPPSAACNSVSLSWTASVNADAYRILKGSPRVDISPYQPYIALNYIDYSVSQNTDYLYQIEAYNGAGTNRSNTRNITTPYCPPTLNFSGNPTSIFEGQSTTLTWSSTFTTSCVASGAWSGAKAVNSSEVVVPLPPPSVTYNLQCSGPGGTTPVQPVTITITPLGLPDWREIIPR